MSTRFTVHTLESAPAASQPLLQSSKKTWGFVPTLHGTLAEAPIALEAYTSLYAMVGRSTLTEIERQVAYQAVNVLHECEYCTAGHTYLSRAAGMPEDVIAALRDSRPIASDARLQALRMFTEIVVRERSRAGDAAVDAFVTAGFTRANVLEVVTIVATKTISNYTNHLTHTPQEPFMADPALNWVAPSRRAATRQAA
jgi:AhpD family alkylhydroperoxidase